MKHCRSRHNSHPTPTVLSIPSCSCTPFSSQFTFTTFNINSYYRIPTTVQWTFSSIHLVYEVFSVTLTFYHPFYMVFYVIHYIISYTHKHIYMLNIQNRYFRFLSRLYSLKHLHHASFWTAFRLTKSADEAYSETLLSSVRYFAYNYNW